VAGLELEGVRVNYGSDDYPIVSAPFRGIVVVRCEDPGEPFSLPGDSGSLIVEIPSGHPAALLFAGGSTEVPAGRRRTIVFHTLGFPFRTVSRILGVEPA
jgi:hypothetical protein